MSYTRFMTPDPIGNFNASHTDAEIKQWQAEQNNTAQMDLDLTPTPAPAVPVSTNDGQNLSAPSDSDTTQV